MFDDFSELDDLDWVLTTNKDEHRSPIMHLPEVLIYEYDMQDIIQCGNNFRECSMPKDDNPVNNTVEYYANKFGDSMPQSTLNELLNIIMTNKLSIFHTSPEAIYMVSLTPGERALICKDSLTPTGACNAIESGEELESIWEEKNAFMTYNEFINDIYTVMHSEDYQLSGNMKKLISANEDYKENFFKQPSFEYSYEEDEIVEPVNESYDGFDDFDEDDFDISDYAYEDYSDFELDLTPATEARKRAASPEDKVASGLDKLEDMSKEEDTSPEVAKNNTPEVSDDTQDAEDSGADDISVGDAVNARLKEAGRATTSDVIDEGEDAAGEDDGEEPNEDGEGETDDMGDDSTDTSLDDENDEPEEDDTDKEIEDAIDDPDAKQKYKDRFVNLYNHIKDTIDSLEGFSPQFNSKYTGEFYAIQTNLHRLKAAIYKICTKKIPRMSTLEIMKAYTTANYAYDTIAQMLKEFAKQYSRDRRRNAKKTKDLKEIDE